MHNRNINNDENEEIENLGEILANQNINNPEDSESDTDSDSMSGDEMDEVLQELYNNEIKKFKAATQNITSKTISTLQKIVLVEVRQANNFFNNNQGQNNNNRNGAQNNNQRRNNNANGAQNNNGNNNQPQPRRPGKK